MEAKLYKKSGTKELDISLFKNPTSEYRAVPFWAWNTKLNEHELLRQIDCLQEMGFGGFYIHSRTGLDTPYLGNKFMRLVSLCNKRAKEKGMIYHIYDEDRFSSGAAGGYTTKNSPVLRKRRVIFSTFCEQVTEKEKAILCGEDYLLACYDIKLNADGELIDYKRTTAKKAHKGYKRIYAYCMCERPSGWRNGGTDIDSMNADAVNAFLDITLNAYKNAVGKDFGSNIFTIFTDEPQTSIVMRLESPFENDYRKSMQWTNDLPETFFAQYHFDLLDHLPELLYDLADKKASFVRYAYYEHTTERFVSAFSDTYAKRCDEEGLLMTGHTMLEDTLSMQTSAVGECMRFYRNMQIPGIDALGDWSRKFMTAKQAQSVAHQYGREGVLSELYGVTGWEADFKVYKSQGDWQAVSGITLRVPHLTWVSMKGDAKRDFPASIGPQSCWYKEFKIIEDHFARLNTVLTRGKPIVDIAVIHPVESIWTIFGPVQTNKTQENRISEMFTLLNNGLLTHQYDFDYVCESLLPQQIGEITDRLSVGKMNYSIVIVPYCITLRKTTIEILEKFLQRGGKVLFVGNKPNLIDGRESNFAENLFSLAEHADIHEFYNTDIVKSVSRVKIENINGTDAENLVCCLREDGEVNWLFITHFDGEYKYNKKEIIGQDVKIIVKGKIYPELYDTSTGEIKKISFEIVDDHTIIFALLYDNDSLLIKCSSETNVQNYYFREEFLLKERITVPPLADYVLSEENVLVLDRAEYRVNDGKWNKSEILTPLDKHLRVESGYETSLKSATQPWACSDTIDKTISLRFVVFSEIKKEVCLCYEAGDNAFINGLTLDLTENGWYVDFDIKKTKPFLIKRGKNILTIQVPFSQKHHIENMYLVGDFGVRILGGVAKIVSKERKIGFSSITQQGMPFYGGAITYKSKIKTGSGDLRITCRDFIGALVRVCFDGQDVGAIAFAPYNIIVRNVSRGEHKIEFKVYSNRENTFGRLYNRYPSGFYDTNEWYPDKIGLSHEYCIKDMGIVHSPIIEIGKLTVIQ